MYKSIVQFIENDTHQMEKFIKSFIEGKQDLDELADNLQNNVLNLVKNIIVEALEETEKAIKESAVRLENWVIEQSNEEKSLLLKIGTIRYRRNCYTSKTSGKSVYLLDKLIGIQGHQRMTIGAAASILEETVESSYGKGGKHASFSEDVSKQTVKNLVHNTIIEMPVEENKEKKKLKNLHIIADEDHVSAQFWTEKGDLSFDSKGRKINTLMPKLICVYEDIVDDAGETSNYKRHRLVGKHYFCGLYKGKENETLWQEVSDYIGATYDLEYLERVYIAGDGAAWIKQGLDFIENSKFVLDKFHIAKYINKATTHLLDSIDDVKDSLYQAIKGAHRAKLKGIFEEILNVTENGNKYREVEESLRYLLNNWSGIKIYKEEGGAVWGCCAEGQISHILSSRMSSRPMGWSSHGADQISKFRAFCYNGGKIINLLKYQKEKQEKEERIEKQEELVKELRKKQAGRKYAEQLQATIPGVERQNMKWLKALVHESFIG